MGRKPKYNTGDISKYIKTVAETKNFQYYVSDRLREAARSGSPAAIKAMKEKGREFAEAFEEQLRKNMERYGEYSHTEYDVTVDTEGFPLVLIKVNIPENYSPSLYPKGYPRGILMPRMLDTGFEYNGGKAVFGKWVKHGIFTYGLKERAGLGFIEETIEYFSENYGIDIEINEEFYTDY